MGFSPTPGAVLTAYARIVIKSKAKQLCRRSGFSRSDEEDLIQELTLRLLEKEHLYDPARGASIDTFADRVVSSAVKMILRDRRRLKRAAGHSAVSLESTTVVINGKPVLLADTIGDTDRQRVTLQNAASLSDEDLALVRELIAELPTNVRDVAEQLLIDGNIAAVARSRNTSRRQIYAALSRAKPHFTRAGFGMS